MLATMEKTKTQNVPTPFDDDLLTKLDEMVEADEQTRAGFIRLLVRQRWEQFNRDRAHKQALESAIGNIKGKKK